MTNFQIENLGRDTFFVCQRYFRVFYNLQVLRVTLNAESDERIWFGLLLGFVYSEVQNYI